MICDVLHVLMCYGCVAVSSGEGTFVVVGTFVPFISDLTFTAPIFEESLRSEGVSASSGCGQAGQGG